MDWTAIATEQISKARYPYFGIGDFKVAVESTALIESRKKELLFIVEFHVLESTCGQNQNDSKASWLVKMSNDPALPNIKQFMIAILGLDPTRDAAKIAHEISPALPAIMNEICAEPTKLAGSTAHLTTQNIITKAGRPFTRHDFAAWSPPAGWVPKPAPAYVPPPAPVQAAAPQVAPQWAPPAMAAPPQYAPPAAAPAAAPAVAASPQWAPPAAAPAYPPQPAPPAAAVPGSILDRLRSGR